MNTKEIRKRKGFYFCLLAFTSVLLLLLLSVVSLFWPTRRFSASERRNLAQRPKLSYEGIVDGTFSNEVESYLADQYPARDIWVYLNSLQNRILGIDYQNGIYRGKDGYLIQGFEKSEIDKEDQEKQPSSWDAWESQKEQSHLQHLIRCMYFHLVSSVQQLPVECQCCLDVH